MSKIFQNARSYFMQRAVPIWRDTRGLSFLIWPFHLDRQKLSSSTSWDNIHDNNIVLQVCQILSLRLLWTSRRLNNLVRRNLRGCAEILHPWLMKRPLMEKLNWCSSIKYLPLEIETWLLIFSFEYSFKLSCRLSIPLARHNHLWSQNSLFWRG